MTPGGDYYSGMECADRTRREAVRDERIEKTIEKYSSDNMTIAIANGSVKLLGRVKDQDVARHVIKETEEIPGVREVTFNLELNNSAL